MIYSMFAVNKVKHDLIWESSWQAQYGLWDEEKIAQIMRQVTKATPPKIQDCELQIVKRLRDRRSVY